MARIDPVERIIIRGYGRDITVVFKTVSGSYLEPIIVTDGAELLPLVEEEFNDSRRTLRKEVVTAIELIATSLRGNLFLDYEKATKPNGVAEA